jgi:phosphoglycerate dehydrogenase-like enzyme
MLNVLEFLKHENDPVWNLPDRYREALARDFPEVRLACPATRAEADALLPQMEVAFGWAIHKGNFALAQRLRWIHTAAASVTPLMFPELIASPVLLTNGRGTHSEAMAEHTIGVLLAFARKLHLARDAQNQRQWSAESMFRDPPPFAALAGSTLGLVGLGSIGSAIACKARALGMRVLAVRRHPASGDPAPAHEQLGAERLPELMERSDWLVLAPPLTAETRGMIGRAQLARLRSTAVLVNLGRGSLVDEPALIEALAQGRIAGAALDVFQQEPLPQDSPLWTMPNVILTPHVSGFGPGYWDRVVELFRRNLRAFLDGRPLENVVDKQAGY